MEKEKQIKNFILKSGWLDAVSKVYFLAQGEYNENYAVESSGKKFVFRINHGSQLRIDNQIEYEFHVLKALESSNVTPKVFSYKTGTEDFGKGVLLMEYLDGHPLDYRNDLEKAAFIFARVHSQEVSASFIIQSNPFRDIAEESFLMLGKYDAREYLREKKILLDYYEKMMKLSETAVQNFSGDSMCIVNTEVNSNNFIVNENHHYLVDWEKSVVSYRYQDLSHFLVPTTTLWKSDYIYSMEEKKHFIKIYREFSGLNITAEELLENTLLVEKIILLRALSWCYMAYYEYTHETRNLKNGETFTKIKEYMEKIECFLK